MSTFRDRKQKTLYFSFLFLLSFPTSKIRSLWSEPLILDDSTLSFLCIIFSVLHLLHPLSSLSTLLNLYLSNHLETPFLWSEKRTVLLLKLLTNVTVMCIIDSIQIALHIFNWLSFHFNEATWEKLCLTN